MLAGGPVGGGWPGGPGVAKLAGVEVVRRGAVNLGAEVYQLVLGHTNA
eukprot:COSAG01_NODE_135_length_24448_cov_154.590086_5_plen_48_part_00